MKSLKISSMVIAGLFLIRAAAAQNPAISTQYTNEEIAQKIKTCIAAHSHDVVPPADLRQKFQTDFPAATGAEWEAAANIYEVEFDVRFRDGKAYYDAEGNLLMTVEEIRRSELPAVVKNAAEAKYPKYHIEDIDKIRRGTDVFYKIEMELGDAETELQIRSNGVILSEKIVY
jgi:2',3'-cyclic-nucleotide 2'-phosphodiesterase (5'-nucleotidase family)